MRKVYVETSVLSRLTDYQRSGRMRLRKPEIDALERLSERDDLQFVTSAVTYDEFLDTQDRQHRIALVFLYRLMGRVALTPNITIQPQITVVQAPGLRGGRAQFTRATFVADRVFTQLSNIFDPADAAHIFQAVRADCAFFLTVDRETILERVDKRRAEVEAACGKVAIVSPTGLLAALTTA